MRHSTLLPLVFYVFTAGAQNAPRPQFTARELFYSAADPAPAAKEAPKPAAPAPKNNVAAKKPPVAPPVQSAAVTPPSPPAAAATPTPRPASPAPQSTIPDSTMVVKAAMVTTAPAPATGTPLGLKYTILKKSGDDMVEVPHDTVFHAGDHIQLSVQTNGPGYLYIVSRGSSGTWQPLFPSPEVADGNNHVDGWSAVKYPPKMRIGFDEQTGTEQIFIVFSRTPEDDLENMIYSLQGGAKAKPAADKAVDKPAAKKLLVTASVEIPDGAISRLRDTYTRDLIIEKVDDKTEDKSSAKQENAVYVVNPSGSSNSRVVAEIKLEHR
jgi:hypothetical protein